MYILQYLNIQKVCNVLNSVAFSTLVLFSLYLVSAAATKILQQMLTGAPALI